MAEVSPGSQASIGSRVWLAGQKLGGEEVLGMAIRSEADFVKVVEQGLPISALAELSRQEARCRPRRSTG